MALALGEMEGELLCNCSCISRRGVIPGTPARSPSVLAGGGGCLWSFSRPSMHRYIHSRGETRAQDLRVLGRRYRKVCVQRVSFQNPEVELEFFPSAKASDKVPQLSLVCPAKGTVLSFTQVLCSLQLLESLQQLHGSQPCWNLLPAVQWIFCSFILIFFFFKPRTSHTCVQTVFRNV